MKPGWSRIGGGFRHESGFYLLAVPTGREFELQHGGDDHATIDLEMLNELLVETGRLPVDPPTLDSVMAQMMRLARDAGFRANVNLQLPKVRRSNGDR